jgi:uracil-DNA glycosylase
MKKEVEPLLAGCFACDFKRCEEIVKKSHFKKRNPPGGWFIPEEETEIMLIGDNPGPVLKEEEKEIEELKTLDPVERARKISALTYSCFVKGRTPYHKNLREFLSKFLHKYRPHICMGIDEYIKKHVYITELVKCGFEKNDAVTLEIRERCYEAFLKREIEIVKPKIIFVLGKAASDFLKSALLKEIKPEIIFLPYHPSSCYNPKFKKRNEAIINQIDTKRIG